MKEDQRVVMTKRMLREAIFRLVQRKEPDEITVTELCAEAGVNRATFYRHYEKPHDILDEQRRLIFCQMQQMAREKQAAEDPLPWLEEMCAYLYDRAELMKILFRYRKQEEFLQMIERLCSGQLRGLRETRIARGRDSQGLNLIVHYYSGGICAVLQQWICEDTEKSPEEVALLLKQLLTDTPA